MVYTIIRCCLINRCFSFSSFDIYFCFCYVFLFLSCITIIVNCCFLAFALSSIACFADDFLIVSGCIPSIVVTPDDFGLLYIVVCSSLINRCFCFGSFSINFIFSCLFFFICSIGNSINCCFSNDFIINCFSCCCFLVTSGCIPVIVEVPLFCSWSTLSFVVACVIACFAAVTAASTFAIAASFSSCVASDVLFIAFLQLLHHQSLFLLLLSSPYQEVFQK